MKLAINNEAAPASTSDESNNDKRHFHKPSWIDPFPKRRSQGAREPLLLAVRLTASRPHPQPQLPSPSSAQTPTPRITTTQSQSVATKKSRKKRGCQPIPHAAQAAPGRLLPLGLPTGPAAGERPSPSRPPVAIPLLSRIARPRRLSISKYLGDCSPALPALVTKSVGFFLSFSSSPPHLHPTICTDGSRAIDRPPGDIGPTELTTRGA